MVEPVLVVKAKEWVDGKKKNLFRDILKPHPVCCSKLITWKFVFIKSTSCLRQWHQWGKFKSFTIKITASYQQNRVNWINIEPLAKVFFLYLDNSCWSGFCGKLFLVSPYNFVPSASIIYREAINFHPLSFHSTFNGIPHGGIALDFWNNFILRLTGHVRLLHAHSTKD